MFLFVCSRQLVRSVSMLRSIFLYVVVSVYVKMSPVINDDVDV